VGGRIVLFVLGLLVSLPGALCLYGLTRGRTNVLRFHEHGIAISKTGHETRMRWEEIASYDVDAFLIIETRNGETVDFGMDGLASAAEVLPRLREQVTVRRALPLLQAAIREGKTVEFEGADGAAETADHVDERVFAAGFALDAKGIAPSKVKPIPWGDVTECGTTQTTTRRGNLPVTTTWIFIETATGNYRAAIEATSEREALTALCTELSPALSTRARRRDA
jgi:hypothetical protein